MGRWGCHDPEVGKQVLVIHNKQFKNNEKVKRYNYLDYMMSPMMATKASVLPSEPHPLRGLELLLVSLPGLRLRLLLRLELRWRLTSPSLASCRCDSAGRRSACRMSLVCVCANFELAFSQCDKWGHHMKSLLELVCSSRREGCTV